MNSLILRAEVVSLDSQVNNKITRHLLKGGSLEIVYPMNHALSQTFNTNETGINMNVVKSSSKLNGMFIALYRTQRGAHLTNGKEDNKYVSDDYIYKRWKYFYNPTIIARLNDHGTRATGANRGFGFANKS